jgi:hypothetical protein
MGKIVKMKIEMLYEDVFIDIISMIEIIHLLMMIDIEAMFHE